ncbi:hypothetical protein H4R19_001058 [Coemansia spiralis]|nr:hypothetical protein H4R19_001058 [Coemansia spiralis]
MLLLVACPTASDNPVCQAVSLAQSTIVEPVHALALSTETGARISTAYNAHLVPFYAKHAAPVVDGAHRVVTEAVAPAIKRATAPAYDAFHRAVDPHAEKAAAAYRAYAKPAIDTARACVDTAAARVVIPVATVVGHHVARVFGDYVGPFARTVAVDYVVPFYAGHIRPAWSNRVQPALAHYATVVAEYTRTNVLPAVADGSVQAFRESRRLAAKYLVPHAKRATVHVYVVAKARVFPVVHSAYARTLKPHVDRLVPWDKVAIVTDKVATVGGALVDVSVGFAREFYFMCYTIVTGDEHPAVLRAAKSNPPQVDDTAIIGSLKLPLAPGPGGDSMQDKIRRLSGGARQWIQVARSWAGSAASSLKDNLVYPTPSADVATPTVETATKSAVATATVAMATVTETPKAELTPVPEPVPEPMPEATPEPEAIPETVPEPVIAIPAPASDETFEEISLVTETTVAEPVVPVEVVPSAPESVEQPVDDADGTTGGEAASTTAEETMSVVEAVAPPVVVVVEEPRPAVEEDIGVSVDDAKPEPSLETPAAESKTEETAIIAAAPSESTVPEAASESPAASEVVAELPKNEPVVVEASSSSDGAEAIEAAKEPLPEIIDESRPELPPLVLVPEPPVAEPVPEPAPVAEDAASVVYEARDAMAGVLVGDAERAQFSELVESAQRGTDNIETFPLVVDELTSASEVAKDAAEPSVEKRDAQPAEPAVERPDALANPSHEGPAPPTVDEDVRKSASNWVKDARMSISKELAEERTRVVDMSTSLSNAEAPLPPPPPPPQQQQKQQQQLAQMPEPEAPMVPDVGEKTPPVSVSVAANADDGKPQEKKRAPAAPKQEPAATEPSKTEAPVKPSASQSDKALPADAPGAPPAAGTPKPKPLAKPPPRKVKSKRRVVKKPASTPTPGANL